MAKMQGKTGRIITIVVLVVALLVVGAILLIKKPAQSDPLLTSDSSKEVAPPKDTTTETDTTDETPPAKDPVAPVVDPQTLRSVDIEPLGITVFYTQGTPGFEYEVLRTTDRTEYVQFTAPELVGTKCTDDKGAFASIIKNPSDSESQTISQTVKVEGDTYGLSLASAGCTGDDALLTQYQTAFKNGLSNLKKM